MDDEDDFQANPAPAESSPANAADRLSDLVRFLAGNLVDEPAAVEVISEQRGQSVHLNLRVADDDLGKVIGRQGRIARAMRMALTIAGTRQNVRASLDIDG